MNTKQKFAVLDLFKKALAQEQKVETSKDVTVELLKYGFVCDKDADHSVVLQWVKENKFNPNTTFYKTIKDVTDKDRFELFMDQILHYFTAYTLNMDEPFIVNDEPVDLKKMNVTHIGIISEEEVLERCKNMLYSGAALKQETIEKILLIVGDDIDIDLVKNREAQAIIAVNKGVYPTKAENALRCLIYQATGNTMLIKDRNTIKKLRESNIIIPEFLVTRFSEIFFRFKPLFLALKKENQYKINRMRRMAEKNNIPFIMPFWNRIINGLKKSPANDESLFNLINEKIEGLTIYKMISLYNLINIKLNSRTEHDLFLTRNGKMYVKSKAELGVNESFRERLNILKGILHEKIVATVKKNVGNEVVKLPLNLNLVCPTSEKNFMGEIPLFSWVDLDFDNVIIGIYWREENGARDLDLSFLDKSGMKIGWNSHYYDEDKTFVYSGDMTRAVPEATELLYKKRGSTNTLGTVRVNPYSYTSEDVHNLFGSSVRGKAKYKVFFAKENITPNKTKDDYQGFLNYMVNPDNIIYSYDDIIEGEKILGTFLKDKFIFANIHTVNKRVSKVDNINGILLDIFEQNQKYCLTLDKVLKDAQVNLQYNKDIVLAKDDILKLFQK